MLLNIFGFLNLSFADIIDILMVAALIYLVFRWIRGSSAMNIFLDHPERFRGAGSMSGVLVLHHSGTSKEIIPGILGVESIYDPVCAAESAINRLERIGEQAPQKIIVISCGTEDKLMIASKEFEQRCTELGVPHITLYSPGKHNWPYWVWLLPYHLKFFSEAL